LLCKIVIVDISHLINDVSISALQLIRLAIAALFFCDIICDA